MVTLAWYNGWYEGEEKVVTISVSPWRDQLPIAGAGVELRVDGRLVGTCTTDQMGACSIEVPGLSAGTHVLRADAYHDGKHGWVIDDIYVRERPVVPPTPPTEVPSPLEVICKLLLASVPVIATGGIIIGNEVVKRL